MSWGKVLIGFATMAATAGVAYFFKDELHTYWDELVISLRGKKIAVLGARGVGKTTLLEFLSTGELPSEYIQTLATESVKSNRFSMSELKLDLKKTSDVSGGRDSIEEWQRIHDGSDIAIYLVNAANEDSARLCRDFKKIQSWRESGAGKPKLIVIVTHLDLDQEYVRTPNSKLGDYQDRFVKKHLDAGLSSLKERPQILMGSLKDSEHTSKLVGKLIPMVA